MLLAVLPGQRGTGEFERLLQPLVRDLLLLNSEPAEDSPIKRYAMMLGSADSAAMRKLFGVVACTGNSGCVWYNVTTTVWPAGRESSCGTDTCAGCGIGKAMRTLDEVREQARTWPEQSSRNGRKSEIEKNWHRPVSILRSALLHPCH